MFIKKLALVIALAVTISSTVSYVTVFSPNSNFISPWEEE